LLLTGADFKLWKYYYQIFITLTENKILIIKMTSKHTEQSVYSTAVPVFTLYFVEDVTSHSGESGEMCNTSTTSVQDDLEEFFIEDSS